MPIDPNILDLIAKVVAVNIVATLVLALLSYACSKLMLEGLASLEQRLDSTLRPASGHVDAENERHRPTVTHG